MAVHLDAAVVGSYRDAQLQVGSRLGRDRDLHVVLCYAWNQMGIVEQARRLIGDPDEPDGIGEVEHISVEMSTVVRDLLTAGATYLGDADVPLPRGETWSDPAVSGGGYGQGQLTHALGLMAHQMGGFDADEARKRFNIPAAYTCMSMIAVGYRGTPDILNDELKALELAARQRQPLTERFFEGAWGTPIKTK